MTLECPTGQDIVIVGATGDLARRKLIPALYNLYLGGLLPEEGRIIGYARGASDDEAFRQLAADSVAEFSRQPFDETRWPAFIKRFTYVSGREEGYDGVKRRCTMPDRLVYLSVPPSAFAPTIKGLAEAGLVEGTYLVVEKPFGHDLESAIALTETIHEFFDESHVFRIDHYLGKETVQNILVFRFGNAVFERVWNRDAIDHIQFTVAERLGIEGRGAFYEETGALRDILQNHVFQVLALLTMEPPSSILAEPVRDEKIKLFRAMRPITEDDLVRGQYTCGTIDGHEVPGYREEPGVAPDSQTETYAAVKLQIDNWRWAGVPFFLRTGKHLPARATEVVISFRDVPIPMFADTHITHLPPNRLTILIQPEEEIRFEFLAKVPGPQIHIEPVTMQFSYGTSFRTKPAEAYERLLHDAMQCDPTLFARADSVERSWEVVEPVLEHLPPVKPYAAGTWGPHEADELIAPRSWVVPGYEAQ